MTRVVLGYLAAGVLAALSAAGTVVADNLVAHQPLDWELSSGKGLAALLAFLPALAVTMGLPSLHHVYAEHQIRQRLKRHPDPPAAEAATGATA